MPADLAAIEAMRAAPLLSDLSKRDLAHVLERGQEMEFHAGEAIVEAGDQACDFYLLLRGRANLKVPHSKTLSLGPGDYFGEMAVLDEQPRSASIRAETDVTALRIGRENFIRLLDAYGSIGRRILVEMSKRVRLAEAGPLQP